MDVVPTTGSRLEVVFSNGRRCEVVVEGCAASTLRAVIREPDVLAEAGALDVPFTVGWPGDRSWYVRPGRGLEIIGEDPRLCRIELAGEATRSNRRRFVRGGGGEVIRFSDADETGDAAVGGIIADLSEGGARCRLSEFGGGLGDAAAIQIDLSGHVAGETIEAVGTVYDLRTLRRSGGVEVVVLYTLTEPNARVVRRYLYERELASRRVRLTPAPAGRSPRR
jgi:hypothetical protein